MTTDTSGNTKMSIEEKAKAYDEALERAKQKIDAGFLTEDDLSYIFPELRESEDEKTRKQLISICNEWLGGGFNARPCLDDVRWLKNLLETQKELTPAEWSEEDERRIDAICELLENTSAIHPNYSHRKLIIWLKSLRPSWKPSEEQMNALVSARFLYRDRLENSAIASALESLCVDLNKLRYGSTR